MAKPVKRRRWIPWALGVCMVLLMVLGWDLLTSLRQYQQLQADKQTVQQQLNDVNQKNESLKRQIDQSQTDEYVIRMARQMLGWVFPGEIRILEEP